VSNLLSGISAQNYNNDDDEAFWLGNFKNSYAFKHILIYFSILKPVLR